MTVEERHTTLSVNKVAFIRQLPDTIIEDKRKEGESIYSKPEHWTDSETDITQIYELEQDNWVPWLQFSQENIAIIAHNFPETQFLIRDADGSVIAALSANRVNENQTFTWDNIAGGSINSDSSDYTATYDRDGGTITAMSISVDKKHQGRGLSLILFKALVEEARRTPGVREVNVPLRPTFYGDRKMIAIANGEPLPSFANHCSEKRPEDDSHVDFWIRNVTKAGLKPVGIVEQSMLVSMDLATIKKYKTDKWVRTSYGYECGQTGSIFILKPGEKQPLIEGTPVTAIKDDFQTLEESGIEYTIYYTEQNLLCSIAL